MGVGGWFDQAKEGYKAMSLIVGCVLIPYALVLMVKNEIKVLKVTQLIDLARAIYKTVDQITTPNIANENDLVCVSGNAKSKQHLFDVDFGVVAEDSYRLQRTVEMFQWKENL